MIFSQLVHVIGFDFAIQWICWSISAYLHTEKFYDLAGSSTFLFLSIFCYKKYSSGHSRAAVQVTFIITWAVRLGLFLFTRILKDGQDRRFNKARDDPKILFVYWTLQGVWVFITLLPSLIMITEKRQSNLNFQDMLGWTLWIVGFLMEVVADYQKSQFRSIPANQDKFISTGLWSISRHPNYFGEILLWFGLFISASSSFTNWYQYLTILSPTFVYYLITRKSGIPLLERHAQTKWGRLIDYQKYVQDTPVLIPSLFWKKRGNFNTLLFSYWDGSDQIRDQIYT